MVKATNWPWNTPTPTPGVREFTKQGQPKWQRNPRLTRDPSDKLKF